MSYTILYFLYMHVDMYVCIIISPSLCTQLHRICKLLMTHIKPDI